MAERSFQLSLAEQVDAHCDRYEADFRAGHHPRIEAFAANVDRTVRPALFKALLELDLELRNEAGEAPRVSDYIDRFPEDHATIRAVFEGFSHAASLLSSVKSAGVETSQGPAAKAAPAKPKAAAPPKNIGRFEIRSVLGEGAFGTVYRARDPQLDRDVALKVPRFAGQQSQEERERFLREARAAAGLHHAHICPVHEVGTIDERDYIVLAFIDGKPLSKLLQTQPKLSDRQIAAVIRKLALALQEAHDHGVIHRDLKPANIMINRKGEPVIMDFGLARRDNSGDAQISHSGQIMGTPAYMSPEQARGDGKAVGPVSDIYSLGVVLYELLCGRRPFEGTVTEVIGQILHVETPQPSQFRADVDSRLQTICMRAIAKKPVDRYASMKDLAAALADYARAAPAETRPPSPAVESGKELPTNQFAVLLAAISSDVESKVERAVKKAGRGHRIPWWSYLIGSAVMGLIVLLGIFFFIKKDTVTVIVNIPIDTKDTSLTFLLDGKLVPAETFAAPVELKPGEHTLIVNKEGALFKRFVFNVGAKQSDPVVVRDATPDPVPEETPPIVEDDLARWQGTWQCIEGNIDQKVITEEHARREAQIQIVDQNSVTRVYGSRFPGTFKLDPTASPKHYDSNLSLMAHPGGPFRHSGVYEFDGDRLRLIFRYRPVDKPIERATWEDRGKPGTIYLEYLRDQTKDGFKSIFNGKDLTGWTPESNDTENWKIQNGAISGIADDAQPRRVAETWLLSDKEYQDFLLRFEFRAMSETVNSGFGYRVVPREKPSVGTETYAVPSHLQVELFENPANRANGTLATGTLIGSLGPMLSLPANSSSTQKPRNEWNRMEIESRGQSIRIRLNGAELVNGSLDDLIAKGATFPGLKRKSGRIALQRLRGAIQFRDVQIKELKPADDGWVSLFNGQDLTGWKMPPNSPPNPWKVENGILTATTGSDPSMLVTERGDYRDLHLRAEAKLESAIAGIKIRPKLDASPFVPSYAVDLIGEDLDRQKRRTAMVNNASRVTGLFPTLNTWITVELIIRGFSVTVLADGKVIDEYDDPQRRRASGHIGLARGPNTRISFRKIEIKELPPETAIAPDTDRAVAEWILSTSGSAVRVTPENLVPKTVPEYLNLPYLTRADQLPGGAFQVVGITLAPDKPSDADLTRLAPLTNLKLLWLLGEQINDEVLTELSSHKNLIALKIESRRVTSAGAAKLRALTNLDELVLNGCNVDDSALKHFADMPRLYRLELAKTAVTGSGLADLKHLRTLRQLNLSENRQLNDDSVDPLSEFPGLTLLDLTKTSVTAARVKLLRDQLPKCEVRY